MHRIATVELARAADSRVAAAAIHAAWLRRPPAATVEDQNIRELRESMEGLAAAIAAGVGDGHRECEFEFRFPPHTAPLDRPCAALDRLNIVRELERRLLAAGYEAQVLQPSRDEGTEWRMAVRW